MLRCCFTCKVCMARSTGRIQAHPGRALVGVAALPEIQRARASANFGLAVPRPT
jgi:hypothetical protein